MEYKFIDSKISSGSLGDKFKKHGFLFLNPNFINGVETYVCYFRQSISIIWNKKSDVIVTEKKLGKIKNDGIFKTNVLKNLHFKLYYPEEYATTIGCRGRFLSQGLDLL